MNVTAYYFRLKALERIALLTLLIHLSSFPGFCQGKTDESEKSFTEEKADERFAQYQFTNKSLDYYQVKLSVFKTEFEKIYFLEKAALHNLFFNANTNIYSESEPVQFFTKNNNRTQVEITLAELYRQVKIASINFSDSLKQAILEGSKFSLGNNNYGNPGDGPTADNPICEDASVACSDNIYNFPSGTQGAAPPPVGGYPDYGCLTTQPCPAWYFMQVEQFGDIVITIEQKNMLGQGIDVDFICWGPFTSLTSGCETGLTGGSIVDCSYSAEPIEFCEIYGAIPGQFYILLITNFSQEAGSITFSQTGGSGVTNCDIVLNCSVLAITTDVTACNPG
ncbi:MAG TPA: hypothetical protein PK796_08680, partial [Bacteroidales bacterium]|nr:hypothetical protein [Bacteroidales bacterium]